MALLEILHYPAVALRTRAEPVAAVTAEVRQLVENMAETMYAAPGIGLAANQVGVLLRVFVIDIADEDEPSDLKVFINPEIIEADGVQTYTEGCLSLPGVSEEIKRAEHIVVRALDADGNSFQLAAEGLLAVAIQHENDHLNGITMIDKVSTLKRKKMQRQVQRAVQEAEAQ
jgi:peptide deformylase